MGSEKHSLIQAKLAYLLISLNKFNVYTEKKLTILKKPL